MPRPFPPLSAEGIIQKYTKTLKGLIQRNVLPGSVCQPTYRVSKEHLFVCNGVATPEEFSFVTLSSLRPDAEQLRADPGSSVQCRFC